LIEALSDTEQSVSRFAALTLGQIGSSAAPAVPALAHLLASGNLDVRNSAAYALAQIGEPSISALTGALQGVSTAARIPAANALREIGRAAAPAVPALIVALNDPDADVRRAVARALERMNTPESQDALQTFYTRTVGGA
ncbi:MAG: HEAT repeat domain-containing protein, partial [Armatimonadetes bacterium]|nr:HEAT repeat domain-containing protein [Anaerolineae bacterium]